MSELLHCIMTRRSAHSARQWGGHIARLIKERADAAGIPMVEDPKLSYLLSKIPLGDEIPPELYRAVAEVLVFVLRMELKLETQA